MTDPTIRIGDTVHDLVERGKMQVVGKAADTVSEYTDREEFDIAGYKSHPLLGVSDGETVWTCTYLPDSPTVNLSGTYDFPESRIARIPVEDANQALERVQDEWTEFLLVGMHAASEGPDDRAAIDELARGAGVPAEVVDRARELADIERREKRAAENESIGTFEGQP